MFRDSAQHKRKCGRKVFIIRLRRRTICCWLLICHEKQETSTVNAWESIQANSSWDCINLMLLVWCCGWNIWRQLNLTSSQKFHSISKWVQIYVLSSMLFVPTADDIECLPHINSVFSIGKKLELKNFFLCECSHYMLRWQWGEKEKLAKLFLFRLTFIFQVASSANEKSLLVLSSDSHNHKTDITW